MAPNVNIEVEVPQLNLVQKSENLNPPFSSCTMTSCLHQAYLNRHGLLQNCLGESVKSLFEDGEDIIDINLTEAEMAEIDAGFRRLPVMEIVAQVFNLGENLQNLNETSPRTEKVFKEESKIKMSDRQVQLDEFLRLKERVAASEVKNGQIESQYREVQEKNAQLENLVKELQTQRDLTQLITEVKVEKQIDFHDPLNCNDSEMDSQYDSQIDQIDKFRDDILAGLKEKIRNLEEKNYELEEKFQQKNVDVSTTSIDSGINDDYLMKTDSESTLMIDVDNPKQVEVASEDSIILNENMLDNGSTSNLDFGPKKENEDFSESFTSIYESLKEENNALKTKRENQNARKFKKRSVLSHLPPNSSILRPATNRPNYQEISNRVDSGKVVPSHTCILCSKSFTKRSNFVAHSVRMHMKQNPTFGPGYCSNCSKSFKNSRGLKQHQLSFHSGEEQQIGSAPEAVQSQPISKIKIRLLKLNKVSIGHIVT